MNDHAREALSRVISTYGPSICHTPRSAEMFVLQECGAFPQESRALVEALRLGVAEDLLGYKLDQPWQPMADGLCHRLQSRARLSAADSAWTVDAWARVLARHPDMWKAAPSVLAVSRYVPKDNVNESTLRAAMTGIVAVGGGLGGAVGAAMVPAVLMITSAAYKFPIMADSMRGSKPNVWMFVALALLVIGLIGGIGSALGAALGWMYGKGDAAPWTGFSTAFGAAFTATAIGGYFCGIAGWFFCGFFSAFGAATAVARRGGYHH